MSEKHEGGPTPDPMESLVDAIADRVADRVAAKLLAVIPPPAPPKKTTGLTKTELARELGISVATIDRLDRDGGPHIYCGDSKRYDVAAYQSFLAARGKKPPAPRKAKRSAVMDVEMDAVLAAAGVREVER